MLPQALERLAAARIELLPVTDLPAHYLFYRDGYAALVERRPDGFGAVGSSGRLTEGGYAALVWRAQGPFFVSRGLQEPATEEQVQSLRQFANDLESALRAG